MTVTDDDGDVGQDTAIIEVFIDSDGDGMPDSWEMANGLDPYDPTGDNGAFGDPDREEFYNIYEFWADTNPHDRDTDHDSYDSWWEGINYWNFEDGPEVWYWMDHDYTLQEAGQRANTLDTDSDDIPDGWEEWWGAGRHSGSPIDPDNDFGHAGHNGDPDLDGMINYNEYRYDCNPLDPDTDDDLLPDGVEDKNENGQYDHYPGVDYNGGSETDAHDPDTDEDGLLDGQEDANRNGSKEFNEPDPTIPDTDGDGILDGNHNRLLILRVKEIVNNYGGQKNIYLMINDTGPLPFHGWKVPGSDYWEIETGSNTFTPYENISVAFYFNKLKIEVFEEGMGFIGSFEISKTGQDIYITETVGNFIFNLRCEVDNYAFSDPWAPLSDADGDGIDDYSEAIYYSGRCADFRVNNSDGDDEHRDLHGGSTIYNNLVDPDSDNDGILDGNEVLTTYQTDPLREDSDMDGLMDIWEIANLISGRPTNPDGDPYHNAIDADSDDDGLRDRPEYDYWVGRTDGISWDDDSDSDGYINILDQDSDNDTLSDGVEITEYDISVTIALLTTIRTVSSDPTIADTDSDGYGDPEERNIGEDGFITDPTDPDTDDDGLLDSGEQYITSFETETRYAIPDHKNSNAGKVDIELSNVKSNAPDSRIYHVEARVGINHSCISDLKLTLDNGVRSIVIRNFLGGDNFVHEDYDLIAKGFPTSDLTTERTWYLKVEDHWDDDVGYIESFEIHIYARTNPKDDDYDGDGLNDSEEVSRGTHGWLTEPYVADTDGDTLTDGDEVLGTTKGVPTNPANPDSDADGYNDNVDRYPLHNVGVKVILSYMIIDSRRDDSDNQPVEPQAVVTIDDKTFSTPTGSGIYFSMNYHYTVDILDDATTASITVEAWEDDGEYDDDKLDVKPGTGSEYTFTYTLGSIGNSQSITTSGDDSDDKDATISFTVETVALNRVNTILINSTDVGLYVTPNSELRYTGEQRFFICYIDVTSSPSGPFVSGMNVIIVPRTTYVDSLFNQSILDDTLPSDFDGLQVTGFDEDEDTTLGAIAGTVFGELTGTQASMFLDYLIYYDTAKTQRSAYYHDVTEQLSTLGLSNEVFEYIPFTIDNSPTYDMPNPDDEPEWWEDIWNAITGTIEAIKDFVHNGLVAFYNFLENVGELLEDIGQAILNFLSDPAGAIQAALEFIIDVLNAIKRWVLDTLESMLHSIIQGIVNIENGAELFSANNLLMGLYDDVINDEPIWDIVGTIFLSMFSLDSLELIVKVASIALGMLAVYLFAIPFLLTFIISLGDFKNVYYSEVYGAIASKEGKTVEEVKDEADYIVGINLIRAIGFIIAKLGLDLIFNPSPDPVSNAYRVGGYIVFEMGVIISIFGIMIAFL